MSTRAIWFARNEQAEALERAGRKQEALALYEANAQEGCDLSFTYERLGVLYEEQGALEKALEALEKARQIERKRGPSRRLVRLERHLESLQQRLREPLPAHRMGRDSSALESKVSMRSVGAAMGTRRRTGCLGVFILVLLGWMLFG